MSELMHLSYYIFWIMSIAVNDLIKYLTVKL